MNYRLILNEADLRKAGDDWLNLEYLLNASEGISPTNYQDMVAKQVSIEKAMEAHPFYIDENNKYIAKEPT